VPRRLKQGDATIEAFGDEFLVVCPRCTRRATVHNRGGTVQAQVVVTCMYCGYNQLWEPGKLGVLLAGNQQHYKPGQISIGDAVDWYFHLPLWLQISCCGEKLWAYNQKHLAFIEDYVQATLRERHPTEHGWSNRSLRSRFPSWMQAAKNREAILQCIEKLKQKA
jgi:ribosomal protein S27E